MLIECPECKRSVSDTAAACPNCGYACGQPTTIEQRAALRAEADQRATGRSFFFAALAMIALLTIFGAAVASH